MSDTLKPKNNITNIDLHIIAQELNQIFSEGFIDNIYEINDNLLQIKCRTKSGKKNLILDASKRINITNYDYPIPSFPSQYCSALRKYMKNKRIFRIYQHEIDRILVIELKNKEEQIWKFIIELFLGGNFILVDHENKVFMAKHYKISKDRKLLAKQEYEFPSKRGENFLNMSKEEILEKISLSDIDLVRTLSRQLSLAGYLAEEICLRAEVDKKVLCDKLDKKTLDHILKFIIEIGDFVNQGTFNFGIYLDEGGNYIRFEPFKFLKFSDLEFKNYESYNEAIDDYYAKFDSNLLLADNIKNADKVLGKYQRIYDSQKIQIQQSIEKREEHLELGNSLFQNYSIIDGLLNTVLSARKKGMSWKEIEGRLKLGKEKGLPEALLFDKSFPKEGKISVIIEGKKLKLDIRKSVVDNANDVYNLAKKDKRRIEGAKDALKKTSKSLEEKKFQKEISMKKKVSLVKRPKKSWYEKFRWFHSTDGFIIVGGKDVSSNEVIVKKHLEKNDLYFHTDFRGAPSVILKNNENQEIPEQTFKETACFAASYSNAWREGWGSAKIFYVTPDQVTKSPNPGEYLKKGSFFIKGKKTFVPKPFLELAIGLKLEVVGEMEKSESENEMNESDFVYFPRIIAGPPTAIKKSTQNYVRILPQKSGQKGGKIAQKIKNILISNTKIDLKKWAELISIQDIIQFLPPGGSTFSKKK